MPMKDATITATAKCQHCQWTATDSVTLSRDEMRQGPDNARVIGLGHTLRNALIDHVNMMHPDKLGPTITMVASDGERTEIQTELRGSGARVVKALTDPNPNPHDY